MHQARVNNQAEDFVDGNPAGGDGFPAARLNPHIGLRAVVSVLGALFGYTVRLRIPMRSGIM